MPNNEPPRPSARIVLADDEPDLLIVMKETLEREGYSVHSVVNGLEALAAIRADSPDIAVLDLKMPRMDGFEVCRQLREDPLFEHMPVIILSASGTRDSKIEGLNLGVDDFINKSIDIRELLARIRMILKRSRKGLDANPLSRLPGNVSIEARTEAAIAKGGPLAILYIDLNQFKAYNDAYGYEAGDAVIKKTAKLLIRISHADPEAPEFLGHIGGDDFILLTTPEKMERAAKRIIADFDELVPSLYKEEDRKRGHILSTDRQGKERKFPLLSISIGISHNTHRPLTSHAQIAQFGAELKKAAKLQGGSAYVIDRRKE